MEDDMLMYLLTLCWNGTREDQEPQAETPLVLILEMAQEFEPGSEVWFDVAYLAQPRGETLFREPGERLWWLQNRAILVLGSTGQPLPSELCARATLWVHLIADDGREFGPFELSPRRDGVILGADIASLADKLGQRLAGIDSSYLAQVAHFLANNLSTLAVVGTSYQVSGFGTVISSSGHWVGGDLRVEKARSVYVGIGAGISDPGTANLYNTAVGRSAMWSNTTGMWNAALGYSALTENTSGEGNTAVGHESLKSNTSGFNNVSVGFSSLYNNLDGSANCAIGNGALLENVSGEENTALGYLAGEHTTASYNVAVGSGALRQNITGTNNTALGYESLRENTVSYNTAVGAHSLFSNTTGSYNTAVGTSSLEFNTTGGSNTALGAWVLQDNFTGAENTAVGSLAMLENTIGGSNTAVGYFALRENLAGNYSTAIGDQALRKSLADGNTAVGTWSQYEITSGQYNTTIGAAAMFATDPTVNYCTGLGYQAAHSTAADYTTAVGYRSLVSNTSGSFNTALGAMTLEANSTGENDTAIGYNALRSATSNNNTACGAFSLSDLTSGASNTAVGYSAGINIVGGLFNTFVGRGAKATSGGGSISNSMALGDGATVTADNQVRIGDTVVSSIGGQVGWSTLSDGRFKRNVREDVPGLEFIRQLRPVTYQLDRGAVCSFLSGSSDVQKRAETSTPESGFIAQEVEAAAHKSGFTFSGVDVPSNDRTPYGLRYGQFVVPLVKAVQEQDEAMNRQAEEIAELKAEIAELKRLLQQR